MKTKKKDIERDCCKVTFRKNSKTGKTEIVADKSCRLGDILEFKRGAKEFAENEGHVDICVNGEEEKIKAKASNGGKEFSRIDEDDEDAIFDDSEEELEDDAEQEDDYAEDDDTDE